MEAIELGLGERYTTPPALELGRVDNSGRQPKLPFLINLKHERITYYVFIRTR